MRISTNQIYHTGSTQLMEGQSRLYKLQNQLSTGKKFLSAQDDPVSAAQVLLHSRSLAVNTQYADNQANASSQLALEETRLQKVQDSIQYIMEQVVAGGNGTYSDSQREYIAEALETQFNFMLGMANSADASGYYLFSGYQGSTKPFQLQPPGSAEPVKYVGDDGQRLLQVGASRQISVSDSGRDIFERIPTGNGTFATGAVSTNTGTGVIGPGSVNDIVDWSNRPYQSYEIRFTSSTNYDIVDPATSATISSHAYTPKGEITDIPGISFAIEGEPKPGDTFTVKPSTEQSMFTTLRNLIDAFKKDIENNSVAATEMKNTVNAEATNLQRILEKISSVQASIGSRRKELESLSDVSSALDLQYQERISNLQDADYAEVISDFVQQQTQLQAAQSSFATMTSLSLFNYIG
jgi:flagellar hook-associated protein 3 FlgL